MTISGGYLGYADISGSKVRTNSFDIDPAQEPSFYDHSIGLRDNIPTSLFGAKGDTGYTGKEQKYLYRPSVVGYTGSISFPLQEGVASVLFDQAKTGDSFYINYSYDCETSRRIDGCRVNSYTLAATSGGVIEVNANIMATSANEGVALSSYSFPTKLVTWDKFAFSGHGITNSLINSFNLSINNNCKYVYTAGTNVANSLNPHALRVGTQAVNGTISFYTKGVDIDYLTTTSVKTLNISCDGLNFSLKCVFSPVKRSGVSGPIVSTLVFNGVGSYFS